MLVAAGELTQKNCSVSTHVHTLTLSGPVTCSQRLLLLFEAAPPTHPLFLQWLAVKVSLSPRSHAQANTQASKVTTKLFVCVGRSVLSLIRLWCEIIICPEHTGDLWALMWCRPLWTGRFLAMKTHVKYKCVTGPTAHPGVKLK